MVITKFEFFEIKREVFFGNFMMFSQSFLGPNAKIPLTINIDFARRKLFRVIDFYVAIAAKHQAVILRGS